jgi:hypothetical protein
VRVLLKSKGENNMASEIVNPPVKFHGHITFTPPDGGTIVTTDEVNKVIDAALTSQFGGTWDSELK